MPEIEEFELGKLRWVLEKKFTPEELVAMSFIRRQILSQSKNVWSKWRTKIQSLYGFSR